MGKQLQRNLNYEATPEQVVAMVQNPEFRTAVCLAQEVSSHEVSVSEDGTRTQVVVNQVQEVRGVPSVVTKIAGESIALSQREVWDGERAEVEISIEGQPGRIFGTTRVVPAAGGSTQVIDWEVEVRIPLVGKKIADVVAQVMGEALDVEHQVGQEWLAR